MIGYTPITRLAFYSLGGFSNPRCVRVTSGSGSWAYYWRQS